LQHFNYIDIFPWCALLSDGTKALTPKIKAKAETPGFKTKAKAKAPTHKTKTKAKAFKF